MAFQKPFIVSITGTKGKTTVSRLLDYVLQNQGHTVLRVDTDGHYLNGAQKGSMQDSLALYGLVPSVCPGRFLYELDKNTNGYAILEVSVGSSGSAGLGYKYHDIGIFTNVFADHLGARIRTRSQLAQEKSRCIFKRIKPQGVAIFNADDKYVTQRLGDLNPKKEVTIFPVGRDFSFFDIDKHINMGGRAITQEGIFIGVRDRNGFKKLLDITKIACTFNGAFIPSVYNCMFACATVLAYTTKKTFSGNVKELFYSYKIDPKGSRLVRLYNHRKDVHMLIDYAHEEKSLVEVAGLCRGISNGKTIGVVRVGYDRTDNMIRKVAKSIANKFDVIVMYDKIDGTNAKRYAHRQAPIPRKPGEIAELLYATICEHRKDLQNVHKILREQEAIQKAISLADAEDIIFYSPNVDFNEYKNFIKGFSVL